MLPVRICAGGVGTTGVPTATGQHRVDEVTRTESRRLDRKKQSENCGASAAEGNSGTAQL